MILSLIFALPACTDYSDLPGPPTRTTDSTTETAAPDTDTGPTEVFDTDTAASTTIDTDWIDSGSEPSPEAWFDPQGSNVLLIVLDAQAGEYALEAVAALPNWFTSTAVIYKQAVTTSCHTPESAPWLLTGSDIRLGGLSMIPPGEEGGQPQQVFPERAVSIVDRMPEGTVSWMRSANALYANTLAFPTSDFAELHGNSESRKAELSPLVTASSGQWLGVWWDMGARLPFNEGEGADPNVCPKQPVGYNLFDGSTESRLQTEAAGLTIDEWTEVHEAMVCHYRHVTAGLFDWLAADLDALHQAGALDNTTVVITSDHGESLLNPAYLAYPEAYLSEAVGHGNLLMQGEQSGFGLVWHPAMDEPHEVTRPSGSGDIMQLAMYLAGGDRAEMAGSLPWEAGQPVWSFTWGGQGTVLGVAYEHDGETYWFTSSDNAAFGELLFDISNDPAQAEPLSETPPDSIREQLNDIRTWVYGQ